MLGTLLLLSYSFEPFHHSEHDSHGDKANNQEYGPAITDGDGIVHKRTNPQQEVTDSRSTQPEPLAETEKMLGSNFGHERESERRDEEFGNGKKEIENDQYPCSGFHLLVDGELAELGCRRITLREGVYGKEQVSKSCNQHTDGNLAGSGYLFTFASHRSENHHDDRSQRNNKERIDSLPYFGSNGSGINKVAGKQREGCSVLME
mgnify:CR=1 FL=1